MIHVGAKVRSSHVEQDKEPTVSTEIKIQEYLSKVEQFRKTKLWANAGPNQGSETVNLHGMENKEK